MKRLLKILMLSLTVFWLGSCAVHTAGRSGKVPPGQAKKITGKKSARDHAPGHRKKELLLNKF
ncbi:hypothetical protein [Parapedobacter indicus]|nr:hypothetical protein [Parapedobacter indicus]